MNPAESVLDSRQGPIREHPRSSKCRSSGRGRLQPSRRPPCISPCEPSSSLSTGGRSGRGGTRGSRRAFFPAHVGPPVGHREGARPVRGGGHADCIGVGCVGVRAASGCNRTSVVAFPLAWIIRSLRIPQTLPAQDFRPRPGTPRIRGPETRWATRLARSFPARTSPSLTAPESSWRMATSLPVNHVTQLLEAPRLGRRPRSRLARLALAGAECRPASPTTRRPPPLLDRGTPGARGAPVPVQARDPAVLLLPDRSRRPARPDPAPVDPVAPRRWPESTGHDGEDDPLDEDKDSPVPGLTHRYPDRALLVTTHVCTMYCRFCTRKRATMKRGGWDSVSRDDRRMVEYVRDHPEIRDVIVSGGDPLTLPLEKLQFFVESLSAIAAPRRDPDRHPRAGHAAAAARRRRAPRRPLRRRQDLDPDPLQPPPRGHPRGASGLRPPPDARGCPSTTTPCCSRG